MEYTEEMTPNRIAIKKGVGLRTPTVPSRCHMSCGSELARRNKRWTPYAPTKSVSLETLSMKIEERYSSLNDAFIEPNVMNLKSAESGWDCTQIVDEPEKNTDSSFKEWSALVVCAKLMRAAFRKTRESLLEQVYRAENSELQGKSTMRQVHSMKSQLKEDICGMRERVKEINAASVLLDELENEKNELSQENEFLKTKIGCLIDERDSLKQSVVDADQEAKKQEERVERLLKLMSEYENAVGQLKEMETSMDFTINEMTTNIDYAEEQLLSLRRTVEVSQQEISESETELKRWNKRTSNAVIALGTLENQSNSIKAELTIATKGGQILQNQLTQLHDKVLERDKEIGKLNEKIQSETDQLNGLKSRISISEKSLWQKMKTFPSTGSKASSIF